MKTDEKLKTTSETLIVANPIEVKKELGLTNSTPLHIIPGEEILLRARMRYPP